MAKEICNILDRAEGKQSRMCDPGCKYYQFDHLETACVLSEVWSVKKGAPCLIYDSKGDQAS